MTDHHPDPAAMGLTPRQSSLLEKIRAAGALFLRGADVRVARALERRGLITLEDNGCMIIDGRVDNERWWATAKSSASGLSWMAYTKRAEK